MSQIPARLLTLVLVVSSARASAQDLSSLPWRAIGPASFGGRIDDIEAVPADRAPFRRDGGLVASFAPSTTGHVGAACSIATDGLRRSATSPLRRAIRNVIWVGTGEAEQPTELHLGRRCLSLAGRR